MAPISRAAPFLALAVIFATAQSGFSAPTDDTKEYILINYFLSVKISIFSLNTKFLSMFFVKQTSKIWLIYTYEEKYEGQFVVKVKSKLLRIPYC